MSYVALWVDSLPRDRLTVNWSVKHGNKTLLTDSAYQWHGSEVRVNWKFKFEVFNTSFFPWFPRTSASRPTNVIMCSTPSHHIATVAPVWRIASPLFVSDEYSEMHQPSTWVAPDEWPSAICLPWHRNWRFCFSRGTTVSIFSSEIQLHKTNRVLPLPTHGFWPL